MFQSLTPPQRFNILEKFANLTGRVESPAFAMQGIKAIKELGIEGKQFGVSGKIIELLNQIRKQRLKDHTSAFAIDEAITEINSAK